MGIGIVVANKTGMDILICLVASLLIITTFDVEASEYSAVASKSSSIVSIDVVRLERALKVISFGQPTLTNLVFLQDPLLKKLLHSVSAGLNREPEDHFRLIECESSEMGSILPDQGDVLCLDRKKIYEMVKVEANSKLSDEMIQFLVAHEIGHVIEKQLNANEFVQFKNYNVFDINHYDPNIIDPADTHLSKEDIIRTRLIKYSIYHVFTDAIAVAILKSQRLGTDGVIEFLNYLEKIIPNSQYSDLSRAHLEFRKNVLSGIL